MVKIGRKMGEIWPKSWRFWRIFEAQMAKSPKTNLGTLISKVEKSSAKKDLSKNYEKLQKPLNQNAFDQDLRHGSC